MAHYFKKPSKKRIAVVDDLSYLAVAVGIIMTLPQVLKIWIEKTGEGVSVITWVSYTLLGVFWIYYGIIHKEKPIIVGNILGLLLNLAVVIGLFVVK